MPRYLIHDWIQIANPINIVANSVSCLGAWTIHIVLIITLKILFNIIPGVSRETSWTLTNIIYMFGSYLMFHYVRGVPFEFNAGAYDNLNMWEQIDNGDQYTPAKKFLLSVPICLFLLSTHYTHYDLTYFMINFLAVLGVVIPKLPSVSFPVRYLVWARELTNFGTLTEPSHACCTIQQESRRSIARIFFHNLFCLACLSVGERMLLQSGHRLRGGHGRDEWVVTIAREVMMIVLDSMMNRN